MMVVIRLLLNVVCWILVYKTVFVSSRSHINAGEKLIGDEISGEGVLNDEPIDRVKRGSPYVSNIKQSKFTDIAHKIKDVIDKIQPDGEVVDTYVNGFRDIDTNWNLFHDPGNDIRDSPIRKLLLVNSFYNIVTIMKEGESDMCPLHLRVSDEQIGEMLSDINGFIKEFLTAKKRFAQLPESQRLAEAESLGRNGTLTDLKNMKTPGGHLLKARIQELAGLDAITRIPPGEVFAVFCAIADGTLTYVSKMFLALDLQSYLADTFYNTGNMEKYNDYFNLLLANYRDVRNLLLGNDLAEPLIQNVLQNMQISDFMKELMWESDAEKLARKIIILTQIKNEIERTELPVIVDVPEKLIGKPDFEDESIKTPIGPWQDGANVTYAIQYRQNRMHSRLGEWMDPITVSGEANPIIRIRVHPKRFDRLVFRKFNDQKPQLVGVLEDKYQTEFRDISRDLYEAAARFDKKSLEVAEILINNGADIDAIFEGGRRAIHAAALSDNVQLAKTFLIKVGNDTDMDNGVNAKDNEGYTPLHVASEAGHRRFIQLLLERKGDVNAKTYDKQWTPTHIAADRGFVSTLKTLLKSRVIDVNSQDIGGFTPLHRAVSGGIPVLEVLMADSRIDLQAKSEVGLTPLMLAVIEEYVDITEALLGNGKVELNSKENSNMTALGFASLLGNTDIVQQLLRKNDIDVNSKAVDGWSPLHLAVALKNADVVTTLLSKPINQTNVLTDSRISPLHIAVVTEQKQIVKDLINHGAKIDDRTASGLAPIHLALLHKKFEIFNVLIDGGADIQAKSIDGSSLLHFAIANNKFDIIESLVKKGVDINAKNLITGETPLHTAARNGYLEVVRILVLHGANVNTKNNQGETPLHYTAIYPDDRADILNLLTSNGAVVDLTDNLDRTALHLAVNNGYLVKVDSLVRKGATVDCKDHLGITPLHMASQNGNSTMVQFLLNNRACKDITDTEGRTPLHQAVRNGHESIVQTLLNNGAALHLKDVNFQTPLHLAIIHNDYNIFLILLDPVRGHVDRVVTDFRSNPYLNSPLHLAIVLGHNKMIEAMYDHNVRYAVDENRLDIQSLTGTAAAAGKLEVVNKMRSILGGSPNENGGPSLCTAAEYGHTDIVDNILSYGRGDIKGDWEDKNNIPICCAKGNLNMMEHLISKGADANITCSDGLTPLHRAANAGHTDVVKLLLKNMDRDSDSGNENLLQVMAQSGRLDEVKTMVDHGAVINSTALGGITLLHIVAQSGSLNEVKELIERGSLVNTTTLKGATPLHFAAKGGKVEIISYLVSKSADVNAVDTLGRTPLHWALDSSTGLDVVKMLLNHGALVNRKCFRGKTPLHLAVRHGAFEVIVYLISKNADANAKDSEGNTPLFEAVSKGNIEIVKELVEDGADVTMLNKYGESPLHYVTAIPNNMNLHKSDDYNDHLFNTVNQPAMYIVNYLKAKGAII